MRHRSRSSGSDSKGPVTIDQKSMGEDEQTRARTNDRGDAEGSADVPARPVRSREDLVAELSGFIALSPAIFGGVDILNIDYLHPLDRAGILAAVLTGLKTSDHRPAVRSIVVVAAPETDVETAHTRAWNTMLSTFQLLAGREMPASALEWFRARFRVISAPDVRSRSMLMLCGNYGARVGMSPSTRIAVATFWEYVAFALNSIIFLLIGPEVNFQALLSAWQAILVAYLVVTGTRALIIFGASSLLRRTRERVPWAWSVILTWGGLRGALPMVLVLSLPRTFPHR